MQHLAVQQVPQSVDLSNTYLNWSKENFVLNGLTVDHADEQICSFRVIALSGFKEGHEQYDLIFIDLRLSQTQRNSMAHLMYSATMFLANAMNRLTSVVQRFPPLIWMGNLSLLWARLSNMSIPPFILLCVNPFHPFVEMVFLPYSMHPRHYRNLHSIHFFPSITLCICLFLCYAGDWCGLLKSGGCLD